MPAGKLLRLTGRAAVGEKREGELTVWRWAIKNNFARLRRPIGNSSLALGKLLIIIIFQELPRPALFGFSHCMLGRAERKDRRRRKHFYKIRG